MEKMFKTKYKVVLEITARATLDADKVWTLLKEILHKENFTYITDFKGTVHNLQEKGKEDVDMENEVIEALGIETIWNTRTIIATTTLDNLKIRV